VRPETTLRGLVRLADVAPTLVDLAGAEVEDFPPEPTAIDGRSVAEALRTGRAPAPVPAVHLTDHTKVSKLNRRQPVEGRAGRWWAYREGDWKLLRIPRPDDAPAEELYDLADDPGELRDRLADRPEVARRLRERLIGVEDAWQETTDRLNEGAEPESLDAARIEALRSLGYID
jgi:arylsulfatase A-like enzyme